MAETERHHPGPPVVEPAGQTFGTLTDRIAGVPLRRPSVGWLAGVGVTLAFLMMMLTAVAWLIIRGVGVWGINVPVAWGFAIINFVWWIGIGHAGTLISAILLLLRQRWRNSINRFAEAMTLFAVANAGMFPLLHLGRPERFYYLLPYPDTLGLWPQWRSPLVWDVIAVLTYGTVSLLFWYLGLIPDLATMRDTATRRWVRRVYGFLALGWRSSARHWQRHQMLYLLLAGLATPLVVSVHSIVSLDFSVAGVPGWHSTIFPPYFVAGAIFSGFAMVFTIAVPLRRIFGLEDMITARHLDNMAKIMLASGLIVAYGYVMELFVSWYSADRFDWYMTTNRMFGPYWPVFWTTMLCNVALPQLLWLRRVRVSPWVLFVLSLFINVGMWVERYMIVVTSLHRDFMPSAWGIYHGTIWDWMLFVGSLGFFTMLLMFFVRTFPMISIYEMRELLVSERIVRPAAGPSETERPADPLPDHLVYGAVAEFAAADEVLDAARRVREAGYQNVEAYTPYPVEDLPEALGHGRAGVAPIVLAGGLLGGAAAFLLQWYAATVDYPWNIGGRPANSWPSFIPLTFELTILGGALFGVVGLMVLNRLPQPYHPIFNARAFERATRDRFFLCIERTDPRFEREGTCDLLAQLHPLSVSLVPKEAPA